MGSAPTHQAPSIYIGMIRDFHSMSRNTWTIATGPFSITFPIYVKLKKNICRTNINIIRNRPRCNSSCVSWHTVKISKHCDVYWRCLMCWSTSHRPQCTRGWTTGVATVELGSPLKSACSMYRGVAVDVTAPHYRHAVGQHARTPPQPTLYRLISVVSMHIASM